MTVIKSQIKKFNLIQDSSSLRTKFLYPKIVLFEDAKCFRLTDLEDTEKEDQIYNLNEKITDCALQDHLLWLTLESGEILITDLLNGLQIKLVVTNYSKVKFHQINDDYFVFKSDCGEDLSSPVSTEEITERIKNGCSEICISLMKGNYEKTDFSTKHTGLNISIEAGNVVSLCPMTGQKETLLSNVKLEYVLSWGDNLVLADKARIWIVDLESSTIVYEFENFKTCVPVAVYKNVFYYLADCDEEVGKIYHYYCYLCHIHKL